MNARRGGVILVATLAGCEAAATSATSSDRPPQSGGPGSTSGGSCFGGVPECYKMIPYDPRSCGLIRGCDWDPTGTVECDGAQRRCDLFGAPSECVKQLGCSWRHPDGRIERAPQKARCEGEAVPCGGYGTKTECERQRGCGWSLQGACVTGGRLYAGRPADPYPRVCGWYSTDGRGGFHPVAALEYCNEVPGCTGTLVSDSD